MWENSRKKVAVKWRRWCQHCHPRAAGRVKRGDEQRGTQLGPQERGVMGGPFPQAAGSLLGCP